MAETHRRMTGGEDLEDRKSRADYNKRAEASLKRDMPDLLVVWKTVRQQVREARVG